MAARIVIGETDTEVASTLCDFVVDKANKAIKENGQFTVGVSGGSLAKFLCKGLPKNTTDWSKWRIFFCDERHVPYDNPECTYQIYLSGLVRKVNMAESNIFPINPDLTVEEAANDYLKKIRTVFPGDSIPRFDMLLLGMGPDGHTCSLFPGHPLLQESSKIVVPISDSPKPPPSRVTMTYPIINNCACAVFASCGASKAEMVQRVLEGNEKSPLPAARVQPTNGELVWFLDKAAAANLKAH
ncbi:6-phosphogluconolactonase-like [Mizuhopecten yessoensis]|uniref:6-phosphogluconolactonase n=1 Tax=Mizuhopecten yessoensis TaxID=6573 RepID=A0A210Q6A3_MIZYE|nr:6-phosphogluconolactonase-like [Mizuhopecten yessoensis]XP_021366083.1 6-phosphogluconolactonase-like [Mizuhopecten yessoensis]OWF44258.1 6-phosphogluconolactonase [Mizuhopecten yessoensis]